MDKELEKLSLATKEEDGDGSLLEKLLWTLNL